MLKFVILIACVSKLTGALFPLPQCPPNGNIALQDPNSCKRFLICINGIQLTQNCANGLEFDFVSGNCIDKDQAKCNPCAANPDNNLHFILDDEHCHKYIMCAGSKGTERQCPDGYHFNLRIKACDLPQNANCPYTTPCPTPPTPPTGTPTPPTGTPTSPTETPTPPTHPGIVEAECDLNRNFELIASVKSCSRYLACACGHLNVQECAPHLVYDIVNKRCDTRENGAICLRDNPIKCPSNEVINAPHPNDKRHYYLCLNGLAILRACPPAMEFNSNSAQCEITCDSNENGSFLLRMNHNVNEISTWW